MASVAGTTSRYLVASGNARLLLDRLTVEPGMPLAPSTRYAILPK
jgi:hypothetical protein